MHRKMGALSSVLCNLMVPLLLCLTSGVRVLFPFWGGEVPNPGRTRYGFLFPFWGDGGPTPGGYLFYNFSQLLDSECVYVPGSVCMTYFSHHSLFPHIFSVKPVLTWGRTEGHFI